MLYIMRHGKTDWNEKRKLQGRTDIPLNEEGIGMAKKAAEECKNIHFDICYCSPLIRARTTAQIVLEGRNVPIVTDDRLMEMGFGEYEGIEHSFEIIIPKTTRGLAVPKHLKNSLHGRVAFCRKL